MNKYIFLLFLQDVCNTNENILIVSLTVFFVSSKLQ